MEDWPASCILPSSASTPSVVGGDLQQRRPGRALQDLSGNVQSYASGGVVVDTSKTIAENARHLAHQQSQHLQQHLLQPPSSKQAGLPLLRPYGPPATPAVSIAPIERKRAYQDPGIDYQNPVPSRLWPRGYLDSQKYKEYRARPRRDTGADGQAVWSDELEEAFQEALRRHPPMGRKKMTQYEKPYGRNELVAEEIFQMTGQRRSRKQVSSHIQVLNSKLKGDPDWERLVKAPEGGENDVGANYYSTSIRDGAHRYQQQQQQSNKRQRMSSDHYYSSHDAMPSYSGPVVPSSQWTLRSNTHELRSCEIQALTFNMRIVSPGEERRTIDKALHIYTQLQGDQVGGAPIPLEDLENWRYCFPRLESLIEEGGFRPLDCDIILLEASLQLMDHYPPKGSKLGIDLDLDYANPVTRTVSLPEGLKRAICVTHFYDPEAGVVKCKQSDLPNIDNQSKVRAVFESSWWAKLFGRLTDHRLAAAQESREHANNAEEEVRGFFRQLTAVQEIYAVNDRNDRPRDGADSIYGYGNEPRRSTGENKPLAVLLWKFRQTRPGEVGTTSWRKLLAPPGRNTLNSPGPLIETLSATPLNMDSLLLSAQHHPSAEDPFQDSRNNHNHPQSQLGSFVSRENEYPSQHHASGVSSQNVEAGHSQWPEYPVIPDDIVDPGMLSPLGLPSYEILMSMNQGKDGLHQNQQGEHHEVGNEQVRSGLDADLQATIAGFDSISEVGVGGVGVSGVSVAGMSQWAGPPRYHESDIHSDMMHGAHSHAVNQQTQQQHQMSHHSQQQQHHQQHRPHQQHQQHHQQQHQQPSQQPCQDLERQRQQQSTPQQQQHQHQHQHQRIFEAHNTPTSFYNESIANSANTTGHEQLPFPRDLHNINLKAEEMDEHLQAILAAAAAEMENFDEGTQPPSSRGRGSPASMHINSSFDLQFQPSQHGRVHVSQQQPQHPQTIQPPSRPQSGSLSRSSPHPHQQQARLTVSAANSQRPITPLSSTSGRNVRVHSHSQTPLEQQQQQQQQQQQRPHSFSTSVVTSAGSTASAFGNEYVDRLVDRVRAGVDGGNNSDDRGVSVAARLGEPWDGGGGAAADNSGNEGRGQHIRHGNGQGFNVTGTSGSGSGGFVEEIGGE